MQLIIHIIWLNIPNFPLQAKTHVEFVTTKSFHIMIPVINAPAKHKMKKDKGLIVF